MIEFLFGAALCVLGMLVLGGISLAFSGAAFLQKCEQDRLKKERDLARLKVDTLRAERLARDLEVVQARAHKLSNDVVLGDLKIESARRALGLTPDTGDDGGAWRPTS